MLGSERVEFDLYSDQTWLNQYTRFDAGLSARMTGELVLEKDARVLRTKYGMSTTRSTDLCTPRRVLRSDCLQSCTCAFASVPAYAREAASGLSVVQYSTLLVHHLTSSSVLSVRGAGDVPSYLCRTVL